MAVFSCFQIWFLDRLKNARLVCVDAPGQSRRMGRSMLQAQVDGYLDAHAPETDVVEELRRETQPMRLSMMQIAPSQARHLAWTVKTLGVKRSLEIGVYTGMSSLVTAMALPDDGYLLACDVDEEWTNVARKYWHRASVAHKIELVLRPALDTLHERIVGGESNSYDFAFIDADKTNYEGYYEACLRLVRRGGVLLFDNMLWGGSVADKSRQAPATNALRELNRKIANDRRVDHSLVPIGDGLMMATVL